MQEPHFMLDIEQRMYADVSGEYRQELLRHLQGLREALHKKRRQLHDRATFQEIQAACRAVDGAIDTIQTIWIRREKK